jgi:hypothetical protein
MVLTNISEWRTHRCRCDTKHFLNSFARPTEFRNDLLVRYGSKRIAEKRRQQGTVKKKKETNMVRPGVHADLMASHIFLKQDSRTFNDARANHEEGCFDFLRVEVIEKFPARSIKALNIHTKNYPAHKTKKKD